MALPTTNRFIRRGKYFGDGSYPKTAPSFVLKDRATGQLYRVTAPGGGLTLVPISALTGTDKQENGISVQVTTSPTTYRNAYVSGGVLQVEQSNSRTRDAYVHDGSTRYIIKYTGTSLTTVLA